MVSTRALIQPSPATPDKAQAPQLNGGGGIGGMVLQDEDEQRRVSIHRCRCVRAVVWTTGDGLPAGARHHTHDYAQTHKHTLNAKQLHGLGAARGDGHGSQRLGWAAGGGAGERERRGACALVGGEREGERRMPSCPLADMIHPSQIRRVAEKFRVVEVVQAGKEGLVRVRPCLLACYKWYLAPIM